MGFSAGRVLGRAVTVFVKNIVPFTLLSLIIHAPLIVYAAVLGGGTPNLSSFQTFVWVERFGTLILGAIVSGAVTFGVFQELRGTPSSLGQNMARGLSRVLSVVGMAIVTGIAIVVAAIPGGIVVALVAAGGSGVGALIAMIVVVGLPAMWVATVLWVCVPALVVERIGVGTALNRSQDLTRGRRLSVFVIALVNFVLGWAVGWLLQQGALGGTFSLQTYLVLAEVVAAFLGAFGAVTSAVCYHDLRVATEGVGTEDLARVFD
jgi:hypothetical protein